MRKLTTSQHLLGSSSLLLVGFLFGMSGVMAKYLSHSLTAYQVVEYRFGIALFAALILLACLRRSLSFRKVNKKTLGLFAITFPVSVILFTFSIFHGTVALAVFSFYTATLISSFTLGKLFFGEKTDTAKKLALLSIGVAVIALTDPLHNFSLSLGLVFGLLSGLVQGVASSFQKVLSNETDRLSLLVFQCFAGFSLAAIILLSTGKPLFVALTGFEWLVAVLFGLAMLAITYLFLVGFKYTNLNTGSILVSSELLFGPLFAYILLSESMTPSLLIGGLFTILAAVLVNLPARKKK